MRANDSSRTVKMVECQVNDIPLKMAADYISMYGQCRTAEKVYHIETAHFQRLVDSLPRGGVALDVGASAGIFTAGFCARSGLAGRSTHSNPPAKRASSIAVL